VRRASDVTRAEALVIWLTATRQALKTAEDDPRLRDAEITFDLWWRRQTRSKLKTGRAR